MSAIESQASHQSNQPPRLRRALWWTVELLAGFFGVLLLALGILCARLAAGPLSTDALTPYIAKAISDPARGLTATIAHGELAWDRGRRVLLARLDGLVVQNSAGDMVASAPNLEARLDVPALWHGQVTLSDFSVHGSQLRLERLQDGQLVLYGVPAAAPVDQQSRGLAASLNALPTQLQHLNTALTHLGTVTIAATKIVLTDRATGQEQVADLPDLRLAPDPTGRLVGTAQLALNLAGTPLNLSLAASLDPESGAGQVSLDWQQVQLSALSGLDPALASLAGLSLPLSGRLSIDYQDAKTAITRLDAKADAGTLVLGTLAPDKPALGPGITPVTAPVSISIRGMSLSASIATSVKDGITAASLSPCIVTFDDNTVLDVSAALTPGQDKARGVTLSADLQHLPTERIAALWPAALSPNARAWVTANIKGGALDHATLKASGSLTWPKVTSLQLAELGGTLDVSGATVSYFGELPPVTNTAARAIYDANGMRITVLHGDLNGIAVQPSDITVNWASVPESIDIVARGQGKLPQVLGVIDRAPLHYASRIGLQPADADGDAAFALHLAFPLLLDLPLDKIQIGLDGTIKNFSSDKLLAGIPLSQGDLKLALNASGMTITGPLIASGIPAGATWKESFTAPAGTPASVADVKLVLDKVALGKLGLDSGDYLSGSLPLGLRYQRFPRGVDTIDINGDLTSAGLHLAPVGYDKPVGGAGSLTAKLRLQSGAPIEVASLSATAQGMIFKGKGIVAQHPVRLQRIEVQQGTFQSPGGPTTLSATVNRLGEDGWQGTISAGLLDLTSLFADSDKTKPKTPLPPLDLTIDAKHALFGVTPDGKRREVAPLHAAVKRDASHWQQLDINLKAGETPFTLLLQPNGSGRQFSAATNDLGAVLRATNQSDFLVGGKLEAHGASKSADAPIPIELALDDYRVRGAPFIASLVSAISAEGLLSALSGQQGLHFGRLRGRVDWSGDNLQLVGLKTSGGALGLTAEGNVNIETNRLDLQGTAVPFNSVNSLLGNIPLIGQILGGSSGVFAATYHASGAIDDIHVSVNPLSILAPGFLRDLFFVGSAPDGTKDEKSDAAAPDATAVIPPDAAVPPAPDTSAAPTSPAGKNKL